MNNGIETMTFEVKYPNGHTETLEDIKEGVLFSYDYIGNLSQEQVDRLYALEMVTMPNGVTICIFDDRCANG
jgi:hypothetical protein